MARWKPDGWKQFEMTAMALDPAGGGDDPAALAMRHGPWFAPLVTLKGEATRDGAQMAATVLVHRRANAALVVDMGGGFGTDVTSRLKENGISFQPFNGANKSSGASMGGLQVLQRPCRGVVAVPRGAEPGPGGWRRDCVAGRSRAAG